MSDGDMATCGSCRQGFDRRRSGYDDTSKCGHCWDTVNAAQGRRMTKAEAREARSALRIDLAKHLKDEHGWRPDACRGYDYMVAGHAAHHPECGWRGLNDAVSAAMAAAEAKHA